MFVGGGVIAVLDAAIPAFIGRVVSLVSTHAPATLWHDAWPQLAGMAAVLLLARPAAMFWQNVMINQVVNPGLSNMIRWQNHWHVVRQSWTFFQNDFAGRIANRVMQTGPALRESLVMTFDAAWYIVVYGSSAVALLAATDWRLAVPILVWFACYAAMLRWFVPRMRDRSRRVSEMRSNLTGRVVDSYTNILTVKLFARARDEDAWVRDAVDDHTTAFRDQTRMITGYTVTLTMMNALLVVSTASHRDLAMERRAASPSARWRWRCRSPGRSPISPAGWRAASPRYSRTSARCRTACARSTWRGKCRTRRAPPSWHVTGGEIRFDCVHFDYGRAEQPKSSVWPPRCCTAST